MVLPVQDAKIIQLISRLPVFDNISSIIKIDGGLTNMNYRVETVSGIFFVRISDPGSPVLGINRENEQINTARAHKAGVGAELIAAYPEENIMVLRWIHAKTLHAEDIHTDRSLIPGMADSLRVLHHGPAFAGEFYFPAIRKRYLQTVLENSYFVPANYFLLEPLIVSLENQLATTAEPLVPCNNDLLAENFMNDGTTIRIIDYEYAGQNEASFEIGNMASEIGLNDEQLTLFCDAYWQQHLPGKIARAQAWSMVARFGWTLWASIQSEISHIDFDFHDWGMKKWNSVVPELEGNRYQTVLENLKK